jgi:histidine triad (HIT) family protein
MPTIFTRIVNGEIPCHKLYEDDRCLSFLDLRPINPGHALVIPKQEIDYIFDVPDELLQHMITVAKQVAHAIDQAVPCQRVGVIVAGLEVPHAHIHLVPINGIGDINFAHAVDATPDELAATAEAIRAAL